MTVTLGRIGKWLRRDLRAALSLGFLLVLFALGVAIYHLLMARALSVRFNRGMVQIFVTFGLAIFLRGAIGGERLTVFGNKPTQQAVRGLDNILRPEVAAGAGGALDRCVAEICATVPRLFFVLHHRGDHLQWRLLRCGLAHEWRGAREQHQQGRQAAEERSRALRTCRQRINGEA